MVDPPPLPEMVGHGDEPFGHSVGFLLSQLGYAVSRQFKGALTEVSVEPRQWAVMRAIQMAQGRSQQVIGEELQIPASSMVAILDQLESRGLVARQLDPSDRRVRFVELTEEGHSLVEQALHIAISTEQNICQGMTLSEREDLIEKLQQVSGNLGLASGIHPAMGHGRALEESD